MPNRWVLLLCIQLVLRVRQLLCDPTNCTDTLSEGWRGTPTAEDELVYELICQWSAVYDRLEADEDYSWDVLRRTLNGTLNVTINNAGNITHIAIVGLSHREGVNLDGLDVTQNIFQLPDLQSLVIRDSGLTGRLPSGLEKAVNLQKLGLSSNQLTGTLPAEWSELKQLQSLDLSFNGLNGTLPEVWRNMENLQILNLSFNQLTGPGLTDSIIPAPDNVTSLPPLWSKLKQLQTLRLDNNKLNGPLPVMWGMDDAMPQLKLLNLSNNAFDGHLPAFWFLNLKLNLNTTKQCELLLFPNSGNLCLEPWMPRLYEFFNRTIDPNLYPLQSCKVEDADWDQMQEECNKTLKQVAQIPGQWTQIERENPNVALPATLETTMTRWWDEHGQRTPKPTACMCSEEDKDSDLPGCNMIDWINLLPDSCSPKVQECVIFIVLPAQDNAAGAVSGNTASPPPPSGDDTNVAAIVGGVVGGVVVLAAIAILVVCIVYRRKVRSWKTQLEESRHSGNADVNGDGPAPPFTRRASMPLYGYLTSTRGPPLSSLYDYDYGPSESDSEYNSVSNTSPSLGALRSAKGALRQQYGSDVQYRNATPSGFVKMGLTPEVSIDIEEIQLQLRDDGSVWKLGDGAFSEVFRGWYKDDEVAVKVLRHVIGHKQARDQLQKELDILCQINQENVVGFKGACLTPQLLMLVLEYLPNGDLFHGLSGKRAHEFQWRNRGQKIALDIAHGLAYLHSLNIVHCDLKSLNILLAADGTAKIADMGMSKFLHNTFVTKGGQLGTLAWAAPELLNDRKINEKVDVYSFGVVLWEIITGETPERGKRRPPQVPMECDQDAVDLMDSCLLADPDARPTAEQVYNALNKMIHPRMFHESAAPPLNDTQE